VAWRDDQWGYMMLTMKILIRAFIRWGLLFGAYALLFALMLNPVPFDAPFVLITFAMWGASGLLDGWGW